LNTKIFVGNLPFSMSEEDFKELFSTYGEISEAIIIKDRMTGRSKGFGFVTFADKEAADQAISEMNGKDVEGQVLTVNMARPKEDRPRRNFQRRPRF